MTLRDDLSNRFSQLKQHYTWWVASMVVQREDDWAGTYKLQALVSGNGEIFDDIGGRVKTSRQNIFQTGGLDQGSWKKREYIRWCLYSERYFEKQKRKGQ